MENSEISDYHLILSEKKVIWMIDTFNDYLIVQLFENLFAFILIIWNSVIWLLIVVLIQLDKISFIHIY